MSWEIAGHEWAARLLQKHIASSDVRHAYLFTGPAGVGRRTLALQFAQALNCLNPPEPGGFCGECRACRQTAAMQQTDLAVIQAEKEGGVLKVESIREVQHTLSLLPYESRYRVALFLRFQEANPNAQNALLKTLEEAPQRVVLLLTADLAESLLPTITSRTEILRLRPLAINQLQAELERRELGKEDARLLAHLAGGRLGYALRLKDNPAFLDLRRSLIEDLLNLLGASRGERFAYAELIAKDRETLREVYQVWLSFWRDLMLHCASADLPLVNLDMADEVDRLAWQVELDTAHACVTDLEQAIARLDGNLNARLLTEVLLLDWPRLHQDG